MVWSTMINTGGVILTPQFLLCGIYKILSNIMHSRSHSLGVVGEQVYSNRKILDENKIKSHCGEWRQVIKQYYVKGKALFCILFPNHSSTYYPYPIGHHPDSNVMIRGQ